MEIVSKLHDARINADNILLEMTVGDYELLVKDIIGANKWQRRRVRGAKTVYALLKEDLLKGCVIPPVVLALTTNSVDAEKGGDFVKFHKEIIENSNHLIILDGLQRTHTILDLLSELKAREHEEELERVRKEKIRVEIYIGINRLGILYRMLTLNTGQTPMSLRQQIEMLYMDYVDHGIEGVTLIKEADAKAANKPGFYNFKEIVEGFNAYLNRDELPIDKTDILENINSLEKLSKENQATELFEDYVQSLDLFIKVASGLCHEAELGKDYEAEKGKPFGKNVVQVFKKPQAFSGFGAAVGKLIDHEIVKDFDDVNGMIRNLDIKDQEAFLEEINESLLWLKNNSKKIGNAQRSFFTFFFRDLFNNEADGFGELEVSASTALRKYQAQNM